MHTEELISAEWQKFESLRIRLASYLKTSEEQFGSLILALVAYGDMEQNVRTATARVADSSQGSSENQAAAIRESMLKGCEVFRQFLGQIDDVGSQLESAARETEALLGISRNLQKALGPFTYIAIQMRLEGARLSPENNETVLKFHDEMQGVLNSLTDTGASQKDTLLAVRDKFSAARESVEQVSASFACRANESESRIRLNLDTLSEVPPNLLEARARMSSLQDAVAEGIRQEVRILQGHDAIRQRLEHILESLLAVRERGTMEPGHALFVQRQQAKAVRELIVSTGSRIDQELKVVIDSAQGIAGGNQNISPNHDGVAKFEKAVDHLTSLSTEVAELLEGEMEVGRYVLTQIRPIQELLSARSRELEVQALAMKILALNVLIGAGNMPGAKVIDVLGARTSEEAESVLQLATRLNRQFVQVGTALQSQIASIGADVQTADSCRSTLIAQRPSDALRTSRRVGYEEVAHLSKQALHLQEETESLVRSLNFADEGSVLLGQLDAILETLLELYPKPERPFDLDAASAGYTMREQHEVHAMSLGGESANVYARLTDTVEGENYGDNVELF
jgi:hypothetical protein